MCFLFCEDGWDWKKWSEREKSLKLVIAITTFFLKPKEEFLVSENCFVNLKGTEEHKVREYPKENTAGDLPLHLQFTGQRSGPHPVAPSPCAPCPGGGEPSPVLKPDTAWQLWMSKCPRKRWASLSKDTYGIQQKSPKSGLRLLSHRLRSLSS